MSINWICFQQNPFPRKQKWKKINIKRNENMKSSLFASVICVCDELHYIPAGRITRIMTIAIENSMYSFVRDDLQLRIQ